LTIIEKGNYIQIRQKQKVTVFLDRNNLFNDNLLNFCRFTDYLARQLKFNLIYLPFPC
jgi:hypothetical protein